MKFTRQKEVAVAAQRCATQLGDTREPPVTVFNWAKRPVKSGFIWWRRHTCATRMRRPPMYVIASRGRTTTESHAPWQRINSRQPILFSSHDRKNIVILTLCFIFLKSNTNLELRMPARSIDFYESNIYKNRRYLLLVEEKKLRYRIGRHQTGASSFSSI